MAAGCSRISDVLTKEDLSTALECPICNQIPLPPIYQCKTGHHVCSTCRPKLVNCAFCQEPLQDTRNFALESIVEASKLPCRWEDDGCQKIIQGSEWKKHLKECKFGPIKCQFGDRHGCDKLVVKVSEYLEHLLHHESLVRAFIHNGGYTRAYGVPVNEPTESTDNVYLNWTCTQMKYEDHDFISFTFQEKSIIYFCLTILGDDEEAQDYLVKLSFRKSCKDSLIRHEATIPVISIRHSLQKMKDCSNVSMRVGALKKLGEMKEKQSPEEQETIVWHVIYKIINRKKMTDGTVSRSLIGKSILTDSLEQFDESTQTQDSPKEDQIENELDLDMIMEEFRAI